MKRDTEGRLEQTDVDAIAVKGTSDGSGADAKLHIFFRSRGLTCLY
jgi:hypothetical protein